MSNIFSGIDNIDTRIAANDDVDEVAMALMLIVLT